MSDLDALVRPDSAPTPAPLPPGARIASRLPDAPPLSRPVKLWYGFGQAAEGIKDTAFSQFLLFYYTSVLGLSGSLAGTAIFVSLIFDAVSDPLVGAYSDRLRSRWGRRHPFMYASALPLAITFWFAFHPPAGLGALSLFAWLLVFTVLTRAAMTLYHVPHLSLGAELTQDYEERTQVVQYRTVGGFVGTAFCIALAYGYYFRPSEAFENGQLNPAAYAGFAFVFGIAICISILLSALGTHRRIPYLAAPDEDAHDLHILTHLWQDLKETTQIRAFRALFFGTFFVFIAFGVTSNLSLHAATYFWQINTDQMMVASLFTGLGFVMGLLFWPSVAQRLDKRPTFLLGFTIFTIFVAFPYLFKVAGYYPAHDSASYVPIYYALHLLWAFGISATSILGGSMMADVTDQDQLIHGRRREGIFFGASSLSAKGFVGVGALIAGFVVDFVGLTNETAVEDITPLMQDNLGLTMGLSLLVLVGIGMAVFSRYDLDRERHAEIRRELERRSRARAADTPPAA